jgi:hypothetical protein
VEKAAADPRTAYMCPVSVVYTLYIYTPYTPYALYLHVSPISSVVLDARISKYLVPRRSNLRIINMDHVDHMDCVLRASCGDVVRFVMVVRTRW